MKIYTLGYSGWSVEAIKTFLESVNGVAVDVRMVPRSRVAAFNGTAFSRLLGERYYWLSDFGNVNYKSNGPNLAKALDVQREINRLVGLYRQTSLLPGQGAEGGGEASDELRAIGEHLLPLGLADENHPLREHARLAAQTIREHQTTQAEPIRAGDKQ